MAEAEWEEGVRGDLRLPGILLPMRPDEKLEPINGELTMRILGRCAQAFLIPTAFLLALGAAAGRSPSVQAPLQVERVGPITGKVVGPDGKPVAVATVFLVSRGRDSKVLYDTRTDVRGDFRLEGSWDVDPKEGPPLLAAKASGFGLAFKGLPDWEPARQIQLAEETIVTATFHGPDGRPVEGLRIQPRSLLEKRGETFRFFVFPAELREKFGKSTDDRGMVRFAGMPQRVGLRLDFADNRFAHLPSESRIDLARQHSTIVGPIRLAPGASVTGRLTNGLTQEPVKGVRIGAQAIDPYLGWGEARTDGDGRFTIYQLSEGKYNVCTDLDDAMAMEWTCVAREAVAVEAGKAVSGVDFQLIKGAVVFGRVTDFSQKPIARMHVGVYGPARPRSGAWVQSSITDKDGRYRLRVPTGMQHVYLMVGPAGTPEDQNEQDVEVKDGQELRLDFRTSSTPPIALRISDHAHR